MQKPIILFLCIALICGLCGCKKPQEVTPLPTEAFEALLPEVTRNPEEVEPTAIAWYQENPAPTLEQLAGDNGMSVDALRQAKALLLDGPFITDISCLRECTYLEYLILYCDALTDLAPLSGLPLRRLSLYTASLNDIASLQGLPLTDLEISGDGITDITPLSGMTDLRTLFLSSAALTDITPLYGLTGLTSLDLQCPEVTSLDALSGMLQLSTLSVYSVHPLPVAPLQKLPLSELHLVCQSFEAEDLAKLTRLTTLSLETSDKAVLDVAGRLPLADLSLSIQQGIDSLDFLRNGNTLRRLSLTLPESCRNLSALSDCTKLESLNINVGDGSIDLSVLASDRSLTVLTVTGAEILSPESLAPYRALVFVYLTSDNLTVQQVNDLQAALPNATVEAGSYSWAG